MRLKIYAILLLAPVFIVQFGKIVQYAGCKWEAAMAKQDCDCNKLLIVHFEQLSGGEQNEGAVHMVKNFFFEYWLPAEEPEMTSLSWLDAGLFYGYDSPMTLPGYKASLFQPPAA